MILFFKAREIFFQKIYISKWKKNINSLWHWRLGHPGKGVIGKMAKLDLIKDSKILHEDMDFFVMDAYWEK